MPSIPQIAFPPRIVNGQLHEIEQGSPDDIAGQVHLLCLTPQGFFAPPDDDFGLYNQAHLAGGADVQEVERQIADHVPDAEALIQEDASRLNQGLEVLGLRIGAA